MAPVKCMECGIRDAINDTPYCGLHQPIRSTGPQYQPGGQDAPIVISSGSVSVEFPDSFTQEFLPSRKKFMRGDKTLTRIEINGQKVADLSHHDVITIFYD